jgi:hypothetical protein
MEFE